MTTLNELSIQTPDDWHLHIRDGAAMAAVVPYTARQFGRAIIMPNLRPPITTTAQAVAYRERILAALPEGSTFEPLMTLYLTDNLPPDEIRRAKDAGIVAVKLYPAGATTNSDAGVTDLRKTYRTLEAMQREGIKLLVHGEVTSPDIDLFDREAVFIDDVFEPLRRDLPELKVVFEHITTKEAAQYVAESTAFTAVTITAHHLLYNRNAIFSRALLTLPSMIRRRSTQFAGMAPSCLYWQAACVAGMPAMSSIATASARLLALAARRGPDVVIVVDMSSPLAPWGSMLDGAPAARLTKEGSLAAFDGDSCGPAARSGLLPAQRLAAAQRLEQRVAERHAGDRKSVV